MVCSKTDGGEGLVCDRYGCNGVKHLHCLKPPLTEIPEGDWFCSQYCVKARTFLASCCLSPKCCVFCGVEL